MESQFSAEYSEMRKQVQEFATSLVDHARTSYELEIMLNYDLSGEIWDPGETQPLQRLKLALKCKQKAFVAHPNVQQLLATIWYEGLPGWRRMNIISQVKPYFFEISKRISFKNSLKANKRLLLFIRMFNNFWPLFGKKFCLDGGECISLVR